MNPSVKQKFDNDLLRFKEIGSLVKALTEESATLRKTILETYEAEFGKLADKEVGEFLMSDMVFQVSRDSTGKEVNVLFRKIHTISVSEME